jgi:hypothetical protein
VTQISFEKAELEKQNDVKVSALAKMTKEKEIEEKKA